MIGHLAWCCEVCDQSNPLWRITREGDVVVSWACAEHLSTVCDRMQRDHEVTRLIVQNAQKLREWAEINKSLRKVAGTP